MGGDPFGSDELRSYPAWPEAMDLATGTYRLTDGWPLVDPLDLVLEIRRCAVGIPSAIARGYGNGEIEAFASNMEAARDLTRQLDAQIALAIRAGYCSEKGGSVFRNQIEIVRGHIEHAMKPGF